MFGAPKSPASPAPTSPSTRRIRATCAYNVARTCAGGSSPHPVDQRLRRHPAARVHQQCREDRAPLGGAQLHRTARHPQLHGPQQPKSRHAASTVPPPRTSRTLRRAPNHLPTSGTRFTQGRRPPPSVTLRAATRPHGFRSRPRLPRPARVTNAHGAADTAPGAVRGRLLPRGEQSADGPEAPAVRRRDAQRAAQTRLLTVSDRKTVARCAADRNRTPASATA